MTTEEACMEWLDANMPNYQKRHLYLIQLAAFVRKIQATERAPFEAANTAWESGPYQSMQRALEILKAGPFDNVDHAAERVMRERADLHDLLVRVSEYLDDRADVRDGEDGPEPNAAMSLGLEVDAALEKLKVAK